MSVAVQHAPPATKTVPGRAPGVGLFSLATLGIAPFFVFALLFLIVPTCMLMVGAFQDKAGNPTLGNLAELLNRPELVASYWISIKISAASAVGGAIVGFFIAHAVVSGALPPWLRPAVMTFSGVASNFAGVPLAFAFVATFGRVGLATVLLRDWFGVNLYASGFNLLSFWGLTLTYLYFQIPLMVLILVPALDGMKREWREACSILGGGAYHYWRHVGVPVLWPSIMGATLLLFANAFGAVATAYALTGSSLNIVTIQLFAQIRGDVLNDPNLGFALAFGMIVVTCLSNGAYIWLRSRGERWLR